MKTFLFLLLNIFFLTVFAQPNLSVDEYAIGFTRPVNISHANDERLFIVEQPGVIKIIDSNGVIRDTAFLDIEDRVNDGGNEQGLLGLAFPSDYQSSGVFYVYYTGGNGSGFSNISRFQTDPNNRNIAIDTSEEVLLTFNQPFTNHNGGDINFGSDGYLYIGTGDGGSAGDPQNRAQNRNSYLGKILRIDVDTTVSYKIPPSNPYADDTTRISEIWSWGLRNPWRYSFDKLTGDLWIGDVGQGAKEEVNLELAGSMGDVNYGWRCFEGNNNFLNINCNNDYTFPIFDYPHNNGTGGFSITGGYVYRGSNYPELYGNYICTDYVSGNFWTISPNDTSDEWIVNRQNGLLTSVSTFGEDINGEIYVAKLNTGRIYKLSGDCPDSTIQVTIELMGDTIISNIQNGQFTWLKDGTELQGQNGNSIPLQGEGAYVLEVVVNDNGCHYYGTSNSLSPPIISSAFSQSIKTIQLYPNPASKNIYANLPIEIAYSLDRMRLINIEGKQEILSYSLEGNNLNLDISKLSKGIYFLEITAKGERYLGKVIKE